jgi:colicin import membrane protein
MRQTKKARKATRNFRKTKRKRGGMPPPKLTPSTIAQIQKMQQELDKKRRITDSFEAYIAENKKYESKRLQKEAEKKRAEEKAAADAKEKAAADAKAKAAAVAKAKAEAEAKAAQAKIAAEEQAKIAAEKAEKAKADAEILEQKKLQKAIDEAAKEERKKISLETFEEHSVGLENLAFLACAQPDSSVQL